VPDDDDGLLVAAGQPALEPLDAGEEGLAEYVLVRGGCGGKEVGEKVGG
jgi:hypothetical protein